MGVGLLRDGGDPVASTELYVDKVVKFISGFLQLILGVVVVILAHALDLECDGHRIFSVLILCQAVAVLLFLLLWYWCYGQDVANHVQELIHHANHLTSQFKRYSEGVSRGAGHREVMESTLHSDLDNYLEFLLHVLTVKGEKLYTRHLVKWIVVLVLCFLWLLITVYLIVECGLPDPLYLQVLWILPLLILAGTVVLVVFHVLYDLCKARDYHHTFFYRAVPGTMESRLVKIVTEIHNPRCVWLLSRHCWHNASLCTNPGLSKSLARKYCYVSSSHRPDRWRDQHFPTLRSDQIDRFQLSSEQWAHNRIRDDAGCCQSVLWCGLDSDGITNKKAKADKSGRTGRKKWELPDTSRKGKIGVGGGAGGDSYVYRHDGDSSTGFRPAVHPLAEDGYMTPNLFVRKLAKESGTPEVMLEEETARRKEKKKNAKRKANPTRPSHRDDLHIPSTGPQEFPPRRRLDQHAAADRGLGLSHDDTEVDYGNFYHPHDMDPKRMQREFDPLTYGVRMSVKKEMAKDVKVWKP